MTNKFAIHKHKHNHTKKALEERNWWCIKENCGVCNSTLPKTCFIIGGNTDKNSPIFPYSIVCSEKCINMYILSKI